MSATTHKPTPGGLWRDCWGNYVEIRSVDKAPVSRRKVWFEIIHMDDQERAGMEGRVEAMSYRTFINRITGFQCWSLTGKPANKNYDLRNCR